MTDRQTLANLVPLAAVAIALAEYLFDHTAPRYAGPWFWLALAATAGLLVFVQVLRFGGSRAATTTKRSYDATHLMRRRTHPDDRG